MNSAIGRNANNILAQAIPFMEMNIVRLITDLRWKSTFLKSMLDGTDGASQMENF